MYDGAKWSYKMDSAFEDPNVNTLMYDGKNIAAFINKYDAEALVHMLNEGNTYKLKYYEMEKYVDYLNSKLKEVCHDG